MPHLFEILDLVDSLFQFRMIALWNSLILRKEPSKTASLPELQSHNQNKNDKIHELHKI